MVNSRSSLLILSAILSLSTFPSAALQLDGKEIDIRPHKTAHDNDTITNRQQPDRRNPNAIIDRRLSKSGKSSKSSKSSDGYGKSGKSSGGGSWHSPPHEHAGHHYLHHNPMSKVQKEESGGKVHNEDPPSGGSKGGKDYDDHIMNEEEMIEGDDGYSWHDEVNMDAVPDEIYDDDDDDWYPGYGGKGGKTGGKSAKASGGKSGKMIKDDDYWHGGPPYDEGDDDGDDWHGEPPSYDDDDHLSYNQEYDHYKHEYYHHYDGKAGKGSKSHSKTGKGSKSSKLMKGGKSHGHHDDAWYGDDGYGNDDDDAWFGSDQTHEPTLTPTPCGKAGKECDSPEEPMLPTPAPTPCGKTGKECETPEEPMLPTPAPTLCGKAGKGCGESTSAPTGVGVIPTNPTQPPIESTLPPLPTTTPPAATSPPVVATDPTMSPSSMIGGIITTLPTVPAPTPDTPPPVVSTLIPITVAPTVPTATDYPTWSPTDVPTSTIEGLTSEGTWFSGGKKAYKIDEADYKRERTSDIGFAFVERTDDVGNGVSSARISLVGRTALFGLFFLVLV